MASDYKSVLMGVYDKRKDQQVVLFVVWFDVLVVVVVLIEIPQRRIS